MLLGAHAMRHQPEGRQVGRLVERDPIVKAQPFAGANLAIDLAETGAVDQLLGQGFVEVGVVEVLHCGIGRTDYLPAPSREK